MPNNNPQPRKILVAVDGSESGYRAADFAIALASRLQSELLFLYVIGASSADPNYSIPANMVEGFEAMGKEAISRCESRSKDKNAKSKSSLVSGDPDQEILKNAEKENCDCIVMGKRGLGRLERLLMGSVSAKVSNLSNVPIILVK